MPGEQLQRGLAIAQRIEEDLPFEALRRDDQADGEVQLAAHCHQACRVAQAGDPFAAAGRRLIDPLGKTQQQLSDTRAAVAEFGAIHRASGLAPESRQ